MSVFLSVFLTKSLFSANYVCCCKINSVSLPRISLFSLLSSSGWLGRACWSGRTFLSYSGCGGWAALWGCLGDSLHFESVNTALSLDYWNLGNFKNKSTMKTSGGAYGYAISVCRGVPWGLGFWTLSSAHLSPVHTVHTAWVLLCFVYFFGHS